MTVSRRSFLKHLGALGALALVSPTGATEAIVRKPPVSLAGMPAVDAEILKSIKGQAIAEEFAKYCQSRPRGDVGRSVCAVETILDHQAGIPFTSLMRGFSIGKYRRGGKYFNCTFDNNLILSREEFVAFCQDALRQLELAWKYDKRYSKWSKPWGTAPPTLTHRQAVRRIRSRAGRS